MQKPRLYMILVGCKPAGRYTEQHDIFFGIAENLSELKDDILAFWPECDGKMHIDAWRAVTQVGNYSIEVSEKRTTQLSQTGLFFINLGGYKRNEFEEYHYKMLVAAADKGRAVYQARQTAFYKHTGFEGAASHIDDKYGIDVDDIYDIEDILPAHIKEKYTLTLTAGSNKPEDTLHLGYLTMAKLLEGAHLIE